MMMYTWVSTPLLLSSVDRCSSGSDCSVVAGDVVSVGWIVVGERVGPAVGVAVGNAVGDTVGVAVGIAVGPAVGVEVGVTVGTDITGLEVGSDDGDPMAMALRCWRLAPQSWSRTQPPALQ